MKFCPYCGADLLDGNVLFCSHCGKKLPPHEAGLTEPLTEDMRPASQVPKEETYKEKKKKERKKKTPTKKPSHPIEEIRPEDDGYDGYYDDVIPPDTDRVKEGLDKVLIKKIVALSVGVIFIISMCVVMLYVL